jgi:D-ribose pyranase
VKRGGILHPGLSHLLASTGHTDYFTICDRGFPVPVGPERIDLALVDGIPTLLDVLRAVHAEWSIDRVVIAQEMVDVSPELVGELRALLGEVPLEPVPHLELKRLATGARATVRTGETVPYANVIVVSG